MRIMSIDGGGVLGIGPVHYLKKCEYLSGKSAFRMADMFAGTSTGSIIAAGLAIGMTACEIEELYEKMAPGIFKKVHWYNRISKSGLAKYESSNLRKPIEKIFGQTKFKDLRKYLIIPASDFNGNDENGVTDFYTNENTPEMLISEAVIRSCSAPSYFEAVLNRFCDGGLFANNPTMAAITEAVYQYGETHKNISVISFATSGKYWKPLNANEKNPVKFISNLITFVLSAASARVIHKYVKHLPLAYYQRIAPPVKSPEMDDLKGINGWKIIWDSEFNNSGIELVKKFM